jgi:hypothetical protein
LSSLDPSRLRWGEWIAGVSAVLLLVFMFALKWYALDDVLAQTAGKLGFSASVNGWNGLTHTRWLVLVTVLCALALVYYQATRRAPAIPATLSVIVTVLALVTVIALFYRVVIDVPGDQARRAGAWLGLASAVALLFGAFESLRTEGIAPRDGPGEIETVTLEPDRGT